MYVYPDFSLQVQAGQLRVSVTRFVVGAQAHTLVSPLRRNTIYPSIPLSIHPNPCRFQQTTQTHIHTRTHHPSGGVVSRG